MSTVIKKFKTKYGERAFVLDEQGEISYESLRAFIRSIETAKMPLKENYTFDAKDGKTFIYRCSLVSVEGLHAEGVGVETSPRAAMDAAFMDAVIRFCEVEESQLFEAVKSETATDAEQSAKLKVSVDELKAKINKTAAATTTEEQKSTQEILPGQMTVEEVLADSGTESETKTEATGSVPEPEMETKRKTKKEVTAEAEETAVEATEATEVETSKEDEIKELENTVISIGPLKVLKNTTLKAIKNNSKMLLSLAKREPENDSEKEQIAKISRYCELLGIA